MASFELGKEKEKDVFPHGTQNFFSLSHARDKTKNIFLYNIFPVSQQLCY